MSSFRLHSDDSEFNNRVDALFSSLATAAVDHEPSSREDGSSSKRPSEDSYNEESSNGRDGEFRRPNAIPLNWRGRGRGRGPRNSTPDYVKNPQKWTKYSMKDTKVLSDRENKEEGLKLFDKLRTRRTEGEDDQEDEGDVEKKIVFKKPVKTEDTTEKDKDESASGISADALFGGPKKMKLPEYVVGKPKQKVKQKKTDDTKDSKKTSSSEVKLGHLMFEEEED